MDTPNSQATSTSQAKPETSHDVDVIIRKIIVNTLILDSVTPESIEGDQRDFIVLLGANSIDALEIILSVEERFGFEFEDHELRPELLMTLNHFVAEVCKKVGVLHDSSVSTKATGT
jgi:acyl carrier protein